MKRVQPSHIRNPCRLTQQVPLRLECSSQGQLRYEQPVLLFVLSGHQRFLR
jgi:hypothetical protein